MFGVSRGRIISAIITTVVLIAVVASFIVFVLRPGGPQATRTGSTALASATATATSGATAQFTPSPGITVTIHATPTKGTTSSSSSTTAYTGGAGGTTATVPPRYPTPLPTSGGSSGSVVTPTPTTPIIPTPTPTQNPGVWHPGPTPTATPPPVDDAQLLSQSPTALDAHTYYWTKVSVTLLNTGTTTWDTTKGYTLHCYDYCWSGWYAPNQVATVAPGQTHTFIGYMLPSPNSFYYRVDDSIWRLVNPANTPFGQGATITVVEHGWDQSGVFAESAPSCQNDGSTWTQHGSDTVSCGGSLMLAGGGTSGVTMELNQTPNGYKYNSYLVKFHLHFDSTSATTYAGVVLAFPSSANSYHQTEFMVSPAGYLL